MSGPVFRGELTGAFGVALILSLISMPCFPKASKPSGCDSPIIGRLRQRSWQRGRLAYHFLWLLLLIDVPTFHEAHGQDSGGPRVPPASFQTTVVQGVVAQYLMNPD